MSKMKKIKISFFLLPFIGIFMVFLYVIVSCVKENEIEIERVYICGQTRMIFKEFENIMIFFLNTFVGIVIYFVIKHYFTLKFFVGPYDLITFLLSRKYMNIDPILKTYQGKKIHFSSIIKKIFKKHEWIDVLIQESTLILLIISLIFK